ncbi:hypothetical protein BOTBODRAFT_51827 [Botryobasidium botryosum FD-172 SS1]|uniref:Uncharacterized protein n=1 Tax=Botryobasidium botryosum (strain FD-172 SS1) TaxID=930990 RepID=A0A067MXJ6_BOTB1|nr:hypothetical protein BOTBODRAFT_51827 [Botryobasidium botryosum FD-172 SS1]
MPPAPKKKVRGDVDAANRRDMLVDAIQAWRRDVVIPVGIVKRIARAWAALDLVHDLDALKKLSRGWEYWDECGVQLFEYLCRLDFSNPTQRTQRATKPRPPVGKHSGFRGFVPIRSKPPTEITPIPGTAPPKKPKPSSSSQSLRIEPGFIEGPLFRVSRQLPIPSSSSYMPPPPVRLKSPAISSPARAASPASSASTHESKKDSPYFDFKVTPLKGGAQIFLNPSMPPPSQFTWRAVSRSSYQAQNGTSNT